MTLSQARALADHPMSRCFATGGEIAEAVDRLACSSRPADVARLAALKTTLLEPRA